MPFDERQVDAAAPRLARGARARACRQLWAPALQLYQPVHGQRRAGRASATSHLAAGDEERRGRDQHDRERCRPAACARARAAVMRFCSASSLGATAASCLDLLLQRLDDPGVLAAPACARRT